MEPSRSDNPNTIRLDVPLGTPSYAALRDQLRRDIVSGQLPYGTRVTVARLVQRYGVSQMPVREALQSLQGEGLITLLPHKGARVVSLDTSFILNIYEIRAAIESLLACSGLRNWTPEAMLEIESVHGRLIAAAQDGSAEELFEVHREVHLVLYRRAGNDEAMRIYDHYNSLLGALRRVYDYSPPRREDIVEEHEVILETLRSGDEARLESTIRLGCERGKRDLLASMARS